MGVKDLQTFIITQCKLQNRLMSFPLWSGRKDVLIDSAIAFSKFVYKYILTARKEGSLPDSVPWLSASDVRLGGEAWLLKEAFTIILKYFRDVLRMNVTFMLDGKHYRSSTGTTDLLRQEKCYKRSADIQKTLTDQVFNPVNKIAPRNFEQILQVVVNELNSNKAANIPNIEFHRFQGEVDQGVAYLAEKKNACLVLTCDSDLVVINVGRPIALLHKKLFPLKDIFSANPPRRLSIPHYSHGDLLKNYTQGLRVDTPGDREFYSKLLYAAAVLTGNDNQFGKRDGENSVKSDFIAAADSTARIFGDCEFDVNCKRLIMVYQNQESLLDPLLKHEKFKAFVEQYRRSEIKEDAPAADLATFENKDEVRFFQGLYQSNKVTLFVKLLEGFKVASGSSINNYLDEPEEFQFYNLPSYLRFIGVTDLLVESQREHCGQKRSSALANNVGDGVPLGELPKTTWHKAWNAKCGNRLQIIHNVFRPEFEVVDVIDKAMAAEVETPVSPSIEEILMFLVYPALLENEVEVLAALLTLSKLPPLTLTSDWVKSIPSDWVKSILSQDQKDGIEPRLLTFFSLFGDAISTVRQVTTNLGIQDELNSDAMCNYSSVLLRYLFTNPTEIRTLVSKSGETEFFRKLIDTTKARATDFGYKLRAACSEQSAAKTPKEIA